VPEDPGGNFLGRERRAGFGSTEVLLSLTEFDVKVHGNVEPVFGFVVEVVERNHRNADQFLFLASTCPDLFEFGARNAADGGVADPVLSTKVSQSVGSRIVARKMIEIEAPHAFVRWAPPKREVSAALTKHEIHAFKPLRS
jgi:hypothetical protein